jgi:hypothetical protein
MAHAETLPPDVLHMIAGQIGERLTQTGIQAMSANQALTLAESFPVWVLGLDATTRSDEKLADLATATGYWHHQIHHGGQAAEFARSTPAGPRAQDWQLAEITTSPIAARIAEAVEWIDQHVHGDPLVRLLLIPAYYVTAFWLAENEEDSIVIADIPDQYKDLQYQHRYSSKEFLDKLGQQPHARGVPYPL